MKTIVITGASGGMQRRQREVAMTTTQGKIGRFIKLLPAGMVERMALAAPKDEVNPL